MRVVPRADLGMTDDGWPPAKGPAAPTCLGLGSHTDRSCLPSASPGCAFGRGQVRWEGGGGMPAQLGRRGGGALRQSRDAEEGSAASTVVVWAVGSGPRRSRCVLGQAAPVGATPHGELGSCGCARGGAATDGSSVIDRRPRITRPAPTEPRQTVAPFHAGARQGLVQVTPSGREQGNVVMTNAHGQRVRLLTI